MIEGGSIELQTGQIRTGRGQNSIAAFLAYMAPRVIEMRRALLAVRRRSQFPLLLDAIFGRSMIGRFPAVQLLWIDDKVNSTAKVPVTEGSRPINQTIRNRLEEDKERDATWPSGFELPFPRAR